MSFNFLLEKNLINSSLNKMSGLVIKTKSPLDLLIPTFFPKYSYIGHLSEFCKVLCNLFGTPINLIFRYFLFLFIFNASYILLLFFGGFHSIKINSESSLYFSQR